MKSKSVHPNQTKREKKSCNVASNGLYGWRGTSEWSSLSCIVLYFCVLGDSVHPILVYKQTRGENWVCYLFCYLCKKRRVERGADGERERHEQRHKERHEEIHEDAGERDSPAKRDDVMESPSSRCHDVTLIKSLRAAIDSPGVEDDEPELRWHLRTAVLPLITNWS